MLAGSIGQRQVHVKDASNYQSFLLRLWRDGANHPWRIALHPIGNGKKIVFTDIRALFAFLVELLSTDQTETPNLAHKPESDPHS